MATQDWEKIKRMRLWEKNGNPGLGEDREDDQGEGGRMTS